VRLRVVCAPVRRVHFHPLRNSYRYRAHFFSTNYVNTAFWIGNSGTPPSRFPLYQLSDNHPLVIMSSGQAGFQLCRFVFHISNVMRIGNKISVIWYLIVEHNQLYAQSVVCTTQQYLIYSNTSLRLSVYSIISLSFGMRHGWRVMTYQLSLLF